MTENEPRRRRYQGFPSFGEWAEAPSDLHIWDEARSQLPQPGAIPEDRLELALKIIRRAAAIDTGALEKLYSVDTGFTMSVANESANGQQQFDAKPESTRSLIQAQFDAYEKLVEVIRGPGPWPLDEAVIRELHSQICKAQAKYIVQTPLGLQEHELIKGAYKQLPNNVTESDGTEFYYCPPEQVAADMSRFVDVIKSDQFEKAHPILQASWAHYAFILIHPFSDGNGRVARLLGSLFLLKDASIPLLIFADQRSEYLDALREADAQKHGGFINFAARCGRATIQLLAQSLKAAHLPDSKESMDRIDRARYVASGITFEELDTSAATFLGKLQATLSQKFPAFSIDWSGMQAVLNHAKNHRSPEGSGTLAYSARITAPVNFVSNGWLQISMPRTLKAGSQIQLLWSIKPPEVKDIICNVDVEEILKPNSPHALVQLDVAAEILTRYISDDIANKVVEYRASH